MFKNFEDLKILLGDLKLDRVVFYGGSLKGKLQEVHLHYRDFTFILNPQIRTGVLPRQEYNNIFRRNWGETCGWNTLL